EALARRKAEEAQAAEEKIQLEKQRQVEERLQREAEARAKQEAEVLKQRKAEEERMQKEAEERLRREAEAKEREEGQKLAEQDASGYADEMVDRFAVSAPVAEMPPRQTTAAWQARIASKLAPMGNISAGQSRGRAKGRRRFVRAAVFALVAGVAVLHVISFDERLSALEKTATAQFKQPVKAKDLHFWLLPTPHWRLQDVIIGDQGQIRIALVKAKTSIIGALFNSRDAVTLVDAESATLNAEGVSWVLTGKAQTNNLGFPRIDVKGVQVSAPFGALPTFDVNALMDTNGNWKKIELRVPGQRFSAELNATDEGARVMLSAAAYILPLSLDSVHSSKPATLTLTNFSAVGMLANKEFLASDFSGEINGGYVSGKARLNWRSGWMLNGEARARLLDTAAMFPALSGGGVLSGSGAFAMQAADPSVLMESARAEGNFLVERGVLHGIDLSQVLRGLGSGGRTPYATLDGTFSYDKGKTQLRNVKIIDGIMTAKGNVDITADKIMSGRFAVELKSNFINLRGAVPVAGTLDAPQFGR
ncbi:MAG: AsmA-like C-terminal region-containing protein, partial [Rugosibacter sp.]|nr:AsmA-like C-terminal region-containing protein [Rugosibacter sp.]